MAERVFKMVKKGATMPEALASLASETADKAVRLENFLRRFRLAHYFKIEQEQFGNDLVPIEKGLNAYTKLSLRGGEVGMWKENALKDLKYYRDEEGLAEILRSTVEEAAVRKIQCFVRRSLVRKRFGFVKKLNDDIGAREAQAAEWRKQNGFGSVPRKDIAVVFQEISPDALEEMYGRLAVSAAMKEHKIHYEKDTAVTLRVNSKAIKFGTFIQTVAHGAEPERMTCLTPEGTLDVHADKEGRIFDKARRWRCDQPDSQLSQQSDSATKIQCLVRGYLVRKRYMKMVAHYERKLLMLQYPDESAAKLAKRWLKRMYRRGILALPKEDAAVRIQSLVRGYLVRKRARKDCGKGWVNIGQKVHDMTLALNRGEDYLGHNAVWWAEKLKSVFAPSLIAKCTGIGAEGYATKIQCLVRGYLKRQNNKKRKRMEDVIRVGDHGMLNVHLSPAEKKRGVGYLGLHPESVYEVKEVLSASEIKVQCIGQSVSYTIPSKYFNPYVS